MRAITRFTMAAAVVVAGLVIAGSAVAVGGIAGTAHDFTDEVATVGLCTFCHTPHRALSTRLLWNHTLSSESFSWVGTTTTTNGTPLPTIGIGWEGVSKNCLSCHDGTVAIGDVAWFNKVAPVAPLYADQHNDPNDPYLITFNGAGNMAGNHPVAHPFPFGNATSQYNSVESTQEAADSGWVANPALVGIRLFNDDGSGNVSAGAVAGKTGIECSSCHDPHNGPDAIGPYYLRGNLIGNDALYICLKCHDK